MNKTDFIISLDEKLKKLNIEERKEAINYYVEMIDERMENGMSEEDAINTLGSIEELAQAILENEEKKGFNEEFNKTKEKVVNEGKDFYQKFKKSDDLTKVFIIILLTLASIAVLSIVTGLLPLLLLAGLIYLVYKYSKDHELNLKDPLNKIVIILMAIFIIPTLIALFLVIITLSIGTISSGINYLVTMNPHTTDLILSLGLGIFNLSFGLLIILACLQGIKSVFNSFKKLVKGA